MRILRAIIECITPLHCGGGVAPGLDAPVITDAFGHWRIPGSSLAGSLRALAAGIDTHMADKLFGSEDGNKTNPSLVWCEDGLLLDFDNKPALAKKLANKAVSLPTDIFTRDHVKLNLERDAAEEGGKFDAGIVPGGARFLLEIRCDGWNRQLTPDESADFDDLCARVVTGDLTLGAKSSIGYGHYRCSEYSYEEINLYSPEGMEAWLNYDPFALVQKTGVNQISPAKKSAAENNDGLSGTLELPLELTGPILIGGGSLIPLTSENGKQELVASEADMVFAFTPWLDYKAGKLTWRFALPGSSLRGVLRHAIYKIARDLGLGNRETIVNNIFGYVDEKKEDKKAAAGKLSVEDSFLCVEDGIICEAGAGQFVQHVAIDRFTGGALDGALFSEEPLWRSGLGFVLRLHLKNLDACSSALLFHALLDLASGNLAVGSGSMRGNGRMRLPNWPENPQKAFAALKGNLAWNGDPICVGNNTLQNLKTCAEAWDHALLDERTK